MKVHVYRCPKGTCFDSRRPVQCVHTASRRRDAIVLELADPPLLPEHEDEDERAVRGISKGFDIADDREAERSASAGPRRDEHLSRHSL